MPIKKKILVAFLASFALLGPAAGAQARTLSSSEASLLQTMQTYAIDTTTGSAAAAATANVNMTSSRAYFPVLQTTTNDKFVVFGGTSSFASTDLGRTSVELIDATNPASLTTGSYQNGVALSVARQMSAGVIVNGKFFIAGGNPGATAAAGSFETILRQ